MIGMSEVAGSNRSNTDDPRTACWKPTPTMLSPINFHTLAEIDPAPGTPSLSHDLLLESGRTLAVTVLGPDGKPLSGTRSRA